MRPFRIYLLCVFLMNFQQAHIQAQQQAAGADSALTETAVRHLPEESIACLSLWPQKTSKLPRFQLAPLEVATAAGLEHIGMDPWTIQRLDVMTAVPGPTGPQFGIVLQMDAEVKLNDLKQHLFQSNEEQQEKGFTFRLLQGPPGTEFVVHQPSPKVLLVGTKPFVKRMVAKRREPNALANTLALAKSSQDALLVVAVSKIAPMIAGSLEGMSSELPEEVYAHAQSIIQQTDLAALRLMFGGTDKIQLMLSATDETAGTKLEEAIKSSLEFYTSLAVATAKQSVPEDETETTKATLKYIDRLSTTMFQQIAPRRNGKRLVIEMEGYEQTAVIGTLVGMLLPAIQAAREAAHRMEESNNLRELGLALHNFESAYRKLPSTVIVDESGEKPLLSWRVAILPYIGEDELYQQFHLDEPWDSPHNITLLEKMPDCFRKPNGSIQPGYTTYVAPVNEQTLLMSDQSMVFADVTDGLSNTIMLVELIDEAAVPWTAPIDLDLDMDAPTENLVADGRPVFQVLMGDGSTQLLAASIDLDVLRAMFTRSAGD